MAAVDIQRGDQLTIGTTTYAIRAVAPYAGLGWTPSFRRMASVTASTQRQTVSSGKETGFATSIASLAITPIEPMQMEVRQRLGLNSPEVIWQTFTADDTPRTLVLGLEEILS